MNKNKTAIELLQSIELERDLTLADWRQAKEIEEKQIKEAFKNGQTANFFLNFNAEKYYKETYEH